MNFSISLMNEVASPNVTKIIPLAMKNVYNSFSAEDFEIVIHNNGIFEWRLMRASLHTKLGVFQDVRQAFLEYKDAIYDVDITGKKVDLGNCGVGSKRFCTMDYKFAQFLTSIIKHRSALDLIQDENRKYMEMLNVSQYFRFMKYIQGGEHFPHYDSDFHYEYNNTFTKYSLVVYFTDCNTGEFAFVNPIGTPFEGSQDDWTRQAHSHELYLKIKPRFMKVLAFPHTKCYTVLSYTDPEGSRIICRGDILYKYL